MSEQLPPDSALVTDNRIGPNFGKALVHRECSAERNDLRSQLAAAEARAEQELQARLQWQRDYDSEKALLWNRIRDLRRKQASAESERDTAREQVARQAEQLAALREALNASCDPDCAKTHCPDAPCDCAYMRVESALSALAAAEQPAAPKSNPWEANQDPTRCHANMEGDCEWSGCPQKAKRESLCVLYREEDDDER